jgi:hypothetical protein
MVSTFEKLNLKNQKQIVVLNAPASFERELSALRGFTIVRDLRKVAEIEFSLAFVTRQEQVDALAKAIAKKSKGDAVVWFAYPKGTSRNYQSEIHRDQGWQVLGDLGFERVRAVAIDPDWSALRFRRVEFIQAMKRDPKGALSEQGKARLAQ